MMPKSRALTTIAAVAVALLAAGTAYTAGPPDTEALQAAQRAALARLQASDGMWRGPAWVMTPTGQSIQVVQTERVGPMLGGTLRVIEGLGHRDDGSIAFNAFAVVSFNPASGKYNFRSYAQGHEGDFPLELTDDGFSWQIQAGPAQIRYTASAKDGVWTEVGERIVPGRPATRIFEMRLQRIGSTDWPATGAPGAR